MKNYILLILGIILGFFSIHIYAQEADSNASYPRNYIYITPLSNVPTFQVCYERAWKHSKRGIFISGGLIIPENSNYGITGEAQYRLYLNDTKNFGEENKFHFSFHFSPYVSYKYLDGFVHWVGYSNTLFPGILSGIKGTYGHFAFDLYIGGGLAFNFEEPHKINFNIDNSGSVYNNVGLLPKMGLQLGFSF